MNHCIECGNNIPDEYPDCWSAGYGKCWNPVEVTPEKETPTPKTVEEVVATFKKIYMDGDSPIQDAETVLDVADFIRQALLAQNQAADERLREVFKQLLELADTEADGEVWLYGRHLKAIAAKHGITNL